MQEAINSVEDWSLTWGFKTSVAKSCFMIYSRRIKDVKLQIYGQYVARVAEFKYIGMWLDERLTWKKNMEHIYEKCRKVLHLMRAVAGYDLGANRQTLLCMYQALIRSILDNGCFLYNEAANSNIMQIHIIQARALRL